MTTILCFGDSNTHGTVAMPNMDSRDRFSKTQRWPSVMAAALGDGVEVINEGQPGRTSAFDDPVEGEHKNGLRVLPALLETHRPVDLVIVMLGTNDLKARFSASAFDIALALERLAVVVRQFGIGLNGKPTGVLFVSPVPIIETGWLGEIFFGGTEKSLALPEHLNAIADRQGAEFLDLANVAKVDPVDGIHLTAAAQETIGLAIATKVQEMLS